MSLQGGAHMGRNAQKLYIYVVGLPGLTRMSRFFAFDQSHIGLGLISLGHWWCEFTPVVSRSLNTMSVGLEANS